jgi:predicted transcriptional regulator
VAEETQVALKKQKGVRSLPIDIAVSDLTIEVKAQRQDLIAARRTLDKLVRTLEESQAGIKRNQGAIMAKLDDVLQDMADQKTIEDGLVSLLENYKAQIDAAAGDQAKIDQVHQWFVDRKKELSDKLLANTAVAAPPAPAGAPKKIKKK